MRRSHRNNSFEYRGRNFAYSAACPEKWSLNPAPVTRLAAVHRAGELAPTVASFLDVVRELWPEGQ